MYDEHFWQEDASRGASSCQKCPPRPTGPCAKAHLSTVVNPALIAHVVAHLDFSSVYLLTTVLLLHVNDKSQSLKLIPDTHRAY